MSTSLIAILAIGAFLLACECLFYYRTRLISDHRRLARNLIIGAPNEEYWATIEQFNSFGTWEDMFWDWRRWSFRSHFPGLLP